MKFAVLLLHAVDHGSRRLLIVSQASKTSQGDIFVARILVVDDDKAVRLLLRAVLERRGHSVVEAENGAEGLQYYRVAPTDLVITDIQMPVMDGLQMIKELRGAFPTAKIIAMSAEKGRLVAAQTFSQCTFEKPLYMAEFLEAVQQFTSASGSSIYMMQPRTMAAVHSVQGDA
jgi:two-component system chemotaxis response regulator CheY